MLERRARGFCHTCVCPCRSGEHALSEIVGLRAVTCRLISASFTGGNTCGFSCIRRGRFSLILRLLGWDLCQIFVRRRLGLIGFMRGARLSTFLVCKALLTIHSRAKLLRRCDLNFLGFFNFGLLLNYHSNWLMRCRYLHSVAAKSRGPKTAPVCLSSWPTATEDRWLRWLRYRHLLL